MAEKGLKQNADQVLFDNTVPRYQKVYDIVFFDFGYSESTMNMPPADKAAGISQERSKAFEAFQCFIGQHNRQEVIIR